MKLSTPFYIDKHTENRRIDLCGEWEFTYNEKELELSEIDFKHRCTLPASAYWNVYDAGLLPHPYEGTNSKLYHNLDENVWYYRRKFTVDKAVDPEGENAFLVFDGVGYYSRIWLNGELLGSHEGMFGGPVCDVAEKLRVGENEIICEVKAYSYGLPEERKSYGKRGYSCNEKSAIVPWNISKDCVTSNGDFTVFGIWREVRLEILPKKHLARPYLYTKSIDEKNAVLGLELNIATEKIRELEVYMGSWDEECRYFYTFSYYDGLSGIGSGESVDIKVTISDNGKTIFESTEAFELYDYDKSGFTLKGRDLQIYRRDIELSDIELWYPNGLGDAKLYDVKIELFFRGALLDTLKLKTGIRTIEHFESQGRKYRQRWDKYHFSVNGRKIFLKGMNWMPVDYLYRTDYKDFRWTLEEVKNAGIQLLRVWSGGGKPEEDIFYELCDELGIMVWQDAFLANDNTALWNSETMENQVCYYLYRIRNHPSLAVHCGGNEQMAYHRDNNGAQYIIQRNVEDLDFTRKYYRTSPDRGSMHSYKDWEPVWYRKAFGDLPFMAECGIHSFPNAKSLRQLISPKEFETPLDKIMDKSFRADFPELLNHFTEYVPERIPRMLSRASHISNINGIDLSRLCEATHMASYEFYQILAQSLREAYPRCVGLMPWVFKRTWTTTAIQLVDGLGEPIAPYYALKNAYSSVICFASLRELDYAPGERISIPIKIINDSQKDICGTVCVDIFSPSFEKTYSVSKDVSISADTYLTDALSEGFTIPEDFRDKYFFVRSYLLENGAVTAQSLYPLACLSLFEDAEFKGKFRNEPMLNLIFENGPFQREQIESGRRARLCAEILESVRNGDRISTRLHIRCENAPAYPVRIIAAEDGTVSYLSDSFFFMDEGEERIIEIETRDKQSTDREITLEAFAWNADKISIKI